MKRLLSSFALALVVVPLVTARVGWADDKRAVLEVPESVFDFGSVPQGAKVIHEFALNNNGTADLQIQRIVPSCGCTAAVVTAQVIQPGQSEKVHVEFDTAGFSGSKEKTVQVVTNDLDKPEVRLSLRGVVLPAVTVDPPRLEFGELSSSMSDDAWTKEVRVTVAKGSDLKIEKVASLSKFVTVVPLGAGVYRVQLSKDVAGGELRDRLVIDFTGDQQSPVNIPLIASIRGALRVVPSTVSFGVIDGAQVIERRVKFESIGSGPVAIKEITSSHRALSGSVQPGGSGKKRVIIIRLDPALVNGDLKATLEIETDSPEQPQVRLNVFAVQPPK